MSNIDSVINGLDEITHYNGEQMFYNDIFIRGIADDALTLLKEQEPMKPIYNEEKFGDFLSHCPVCKKVLPNVSQYGKSNFCHNCGQAVKWE